MTDNHTTERNVAKDMIAGASPSQRDALLAWALELTEIRKAPVAAIAKARLAVRATAKRRVLAPIIKANFRRTKDVMWSERSWPARLGILGLTIGTLGLSGQAAGLAAFGRAVSVPIWLVLTAGGTLLGAIIQELQQQSGHSTPTTTYSVIEAREVKKR